MNEMQTQETAREVIERERESVGLSAAAMPTALALYLNDALYERVSAVALRISKAQGVTPLHLIGQPEACFAVVSRAITWRLDPFAVAGATYTTPGGQIGFEGKLILAILENSGRLASPVSFEHYGDWSNVQGKFEMRASSTGKGKYAAALWTDDDARKGRPDPAVYPLAQSCGVRVSARVRGESQPRTMDFDLIQAQPRNSTLWATDPKTQICYTAARRYANSVVPALMMGVPFDPLDNFGPAIDVTPVRDDKADVINMPRARAVAEAADLEGAETTGSAETPRGIAEQLRAGVEAAGGVATFEEAKQAASNDGGKQEATSGKVEVPSGKTEAAKPEPQPMGQQFKPEKELFEQPKGATAEENAPIRFASPAQQNAVKAAAKTAGLSEDGLAALLGNTFGCGLSNMPQMIVNKAMTEIAKAKAA